MIRRAPAILAAKATIKPIGPPPRIATLSPTRTPRGLRHGHHRQRFGKGGISRGTLRELLTLARY
jgi:hypothetical protein